MLRDCRVWETERVFRLILPRGLGSPFTVHLPRVVRCGGRPIEKARRTRSSDGARVRSCNSSVAVGALFILVVVRFDG